MVVSIYIASPSDLAHGHAQFEVFLKSQVFQSRSKAQSKPQRQKSDGRPVGMHREIEAHSL
jgi:hypothetical protein